jgi:MFS transporter, DHA1 family, inner membrane transport protein
LQRSLALPDSFLGHMTAAVQLGFIAGTLVFAVLAISDRSSPRSTFLVCSLLGAASNGATYFLEASISLLVVARFAAGFFLAGIYPVGMKIASDGIGAISEWLSAFWSAPWCWVRRCRTSSGDWTNPCPGKRSC